AHTVARSLLSLDRMRLAVLGALSITILGARPAAALKVARMTDHGYIVVDEPGVGRQWGGMPPYIVGQDAAQFTVDLTKALAAVPGADKARPLGMVASEQRSPA